MLFTPLFADQHRNALKAVAAGHGLRLSFNEITVETLTEHLNTILTNDMYSKRAKEISRIFNDNLVHPMDEAIFWIEYIIRSNDGGKHLKSNAVTMTWFSYLMLDVLIVPFLIIFIIYQIVKKIK